MVCSLRISALTWYVVERLAVLPLVARDHVDWLLQQVEIEVLVTEARGEIKVAVNERLGSSIEQGVYVALVPTSLFYGLELTVEVIEPLTYIALVRF